MNYKIMMEAMAVERKNLAIIALAILAIFGVFQIIELVTRSEAGIAPSERFAGAPGVVMEEKALTRAAPEPVSAPETAERKIIQRGFITVEVKDFKSSSRDVERIANEAGGFVSDSSSFVTEDGQRRGTITIRVPKDKFKDVMEKLEDIGEVKSKSVSGEDVTEEFIDLEARLDNFERQEKRLVEILDKATTVEDILKVEAQLERVRGEIERITGRLRFLENRIDLATITVELFEPEPITQSFGIRDALARAFEGFIATINGMIIATGTLLPIAVLAVVAYVLYRATKKRGVAA